MNIISDTMISDHFTYLPRNEEQSPCGIDILGSGYSDIASSQPYPPTKHPSGHYFDWQKGRILNEYQLIYITKGSGFIETAETEPKSFEAPFAFILFPNVWHRYRPDAQTGWQEHWFAFSGSFPNTLQDTGTISPQDPFFEIGHSDRLLAQVQLAHDEIRNEGYGFRDVAGSAVMQMLTLAINLPHREREENQSMRSVVRQACFRMRERTDTAISLEELSKELNVGYTYFRRMFKTYTGMSPKQYHTQLRLQRAKRLLNETDLSIVEIAATLNFDNPFHFSNWFKKLTDKSPSNWRK